MKKIISTLAICGLLGLSGIGKVFAGTVGAAYQASENSAPTAQGWRNYLSGQASGSLVQDNGKLAWKADGNLGRAQWQIVPDAAQQRVAKEYGWKLTWNSRIASGGFVTDYYADGSVRFLPVLSLNDNGDLQVELSGLGNYTLVNANGAADYHQYEVIFNADTQSAVFKFDGRVIASNWQGEATSQNMLVFGNGSTGIAGVAYYRSVSFSIFDEGALQPLLSWDTAAQTFNGSSDFVSVSDNVSQLAGLTQGSFVTSFRAKGTTATLFSISDADAPSSEYAIVINGDGSLRVHARNNGSFINDTQTSGGYADDRVHNAVVTVSAAGTKIFVDGTLVHVGSATGFFSAVTGLDVAHLGRNYDSGGGQWYFNGSIYQTQIFPQVLSDSEAIRLSRSGAALASYQANAELTPADLGRRQDYTGASPGTLVDDNGQLAWQVAGNGGRAEWEVVPSDRVNNLASQRGWRMQAVVKVTAGGAISAYYGNGVRRFLVQLSVNSNGDLLAELENGGVHVLQAGTGADKFQHLAVEFHPASAQATFSFNGRAIETWGGSATVQNIIVWGNGSSNVDGSAHFAQVSFDILNNDNRVFESVVFQGGQEGAEGSSNFRIPSMVQATDGSLLAFIEGRPNGGDPGVSGIINISLKRSVDQGRNWLPLQIIERQTGFDYSDPRPVVDRQTGEVFVFYTQWLDLCAQNYDCIGPNDPNYLLYKKSLDNGVTWSDVVNVSAQVKDPTWRSINAGPGHGIQLQWQSAQQGQNGRLLFPAIVRAANSAFYVVTIYSDDHGSTWQRGALTPISGPTEADIVELTDGRLLMTARNDGAASVSRFHFLSNDGGQSWQQTSHNLQVSRVDSGITRFSAVRSGDSEDRIIVSGPIGSPAGSNRYNLGLWSSNNEGASFDAPLQLVSGYSAYSDVITLSDGTVGIIYEATGSTLVKFIHVDLNAKQ